MTFFVFFLWILAQCFPLKIRRQFCAFSQLFFVTLRHFYFFFPLNFRYIFLENFPLDSRSILVFFKMNFRPYFVFMENFSLNFHSSEFLSLFCFLWILHKLFPLNFRSNFCSSSFRFLLFLLWVFRTFIYFFFWNFAPILYIFC